MTALSAAILYGSGAMGFVLALHLALLPGRHRSANRLLAAIFGLIGLSSGLLATHLLQDTPNVIPIRALIVLIVVPGLYIFFRSIRNGATVLSRGNWVHGIPVMAGVLCLAVDADWMVDFVLLGTQALYAVGLVAIWRSDTPTVSGLAVQSERIRHWLVAVIVFLVGSTAIDIAIAIDLGTGGTLPTSYPLLFAIFLAGLFLTYSIFGALGRPSLFEGLYQAASDARQKGSEHSDGPLDRETVSLARKIEAALSDPSVLGDEAMSLTRLARRLGVSPRRVSEAANKALHRSFSDLLNDGRVALAQRLLEQQSQPDLLTVMMDAGYISKSNFYKQFAKRTGLAPGAYKKAVRFSIPSSDHHGVT